MATLKQQLAFAELRFHLIREVDRTVPHPETNEDGKRVAAAGYEVAYCMACGKATVRSQRQDNEISPLREYCGRWECRQLR